MLRKLMNRVFIAKVAGVALTGWLLACSFPLPPGLEGLEGAGAAWMALIPLMIVSRCSRPRAAFGWGWFGGMLFWLLSLSWLLSLRHTWGNAFLPALGWIALSAYCALFIGLFAYLFALLPGGGAVVAVEGDDAVHGVPMPIHGGGGVALRMLPVLAAPVLWVGSEVLRGTLFTGFPWNPLGVSQYRNVAAIQIAGFGGVYVVSALIVLLNAALAMTILRVVNEVRQRVPRRRRVHIELMVGLAVVALCWSWGVRVVRRESQLAAKTTLRVAAVQPAVPQVQKWSEEHERDIYTTLRGQTELALMSRPDLVVWPETTTPGMLRVDPVSLNLATSLTSEGAWLLAGSMDYTQPDGAEVRYLNGSFLLSPAGAISAVYHKRHLVLFGETLPFESWFPFMKRWAPLGFSCISGQADQPLMRLIPDASGPGAEVLLSILICFEDAFPYLARQDVRRGARLLINQTNDSWFDGSAASRQHMANAVLRTVENRVPLVRAANTGVTCFVDRFGRVTDLFMTADGDTQSRGFSVAAVGVPAADMPLTLYSRYGDWLFGLPCAFLTVMAALLPIRKRFRIAGRSAPGSD